MSPADGAAPPADAFDCLWCGRQHTPRSPDDLEVWTRLCPDCLGRAQTNPFLRARLRAGIRARAAAGPGLKAGASVPSPAEPPAAREPSAPTGSQAPGDLDAEMIRYYSARAREYDDWYLRRGRYAHGPIHDMAWAADLDAAGAWLDRLPFRGEIVELAAGTGWWSPLLATKGTLWLYDAAPEPLERARDRLVAHGLRAHIHVRDAWTEPDRQVAGVFAGFWLSHVGRDRLDEFLGIVARWLEPGGLFAFIDSCPDPQSGAVDHAPPGDAPPGDTATGGTATEAGRDVQVRRLADGTPFRVRKVFHEPGELAAALGRAGFSDVDVTTTSRFFVLGSARRA